MRKISTIIIILSIIASANFGIAQAEENPEPFFYINILAPNISHPRYVHATLMVEQLPKIGIGVEVFDHTGWSQIVPRTWGYPGPYPIPSYPEGGYDVLFVGWYWWDRWTPEGLFDTASITPVGDNFYQYSNPILDEITKIYSVTLNESKHIDYIKQIQSILYVDLPSIVFFYLTEIYPYDSQLEGFNATLWLNNFQSMVNWSISTQTDFHYALPTDFDEFHPLRCDNEYDNRWLSQIYNGLFERSPSTGSYIPWLAESISTKDDLTYTITLKSDAVWGDGIAVTTDDIIYNYQLAVTKKAYADNYYQFINYWDNNSIAKINDKEFTFTFKKKSFMNFDFLSLNLIPKHIWQSIIPENQGTTAAEWAENNPEKIFGAGPFLLEELDVANGIIQLTPNQYFDDWYGFSPKFNKVFFEYYSNKEGALAALNSGIIDMVDSNFSPTIPELDELGLNYSVAYSGSVHEMAINMLHPYLGTGESCPIANEKSANYIRKAISHIIPREIICDEVYDGAALPGLSPCPPSIVGFDTSLLPYEYNKETALNYMKLAGFDITPYVSTKIVKGFSFSFYLSLLSLLGAKIILKRINQK